MNEINEVWAQVEPYVMGIVNILLTGGLGAFLARLLASRWLKRQDVNALLDGFTKRLTGSKINVDLTAVTEKKLAEIERHLEKRITEGDARNEMILQGVGEILDAIKSSAKLSEAKKAELVAKLEQVKKTSAPVEEREEITVTLAPQEGETDAEGQEAAPEEKASTLVNFGS